jgi:hypothetical protein
MNELTKKDYIKILNYYNKPIPKSLHLLKSEAQEILSSKLCKCIKKIDPQNEARSIGICTKSIFNKKGLVREDFKCKGKQNVTFRKRKNVKKTLKNA